MQQDDDVASESAGTVDNDGELAEIDTQSLLRDAMQASNDFNFERAVELCKKVIVAEPESPLPFFVMAIVAFNMNDLGQTLQMAGIAHEMDSDNREYLEMLAVVSARVGRLTDAVYYAKLSSVAESDPIVRGYLPRQFTNFEVAMKAAAPSMHGLEGEGALNLNDLNRAHIEFSAELKINADNKQALMGMARSAMLLGRQTQAMGALQSLRKLEPENMMVLALMARVLVQLGRLGEAQAVALQALRECRGDAEVYVQAMSALQRIAGIEATTIKQFASDFAADFIRENDMDEIEPYRVAADRPIHLGFISNAFYRSPIAEYMAPWFDLPVPTGQEVSGYQQSVANDAVTTRISRGCNNWRRVQDVDPWTLALSMAADELDVLVDLSHTDAETKATTIGLASAPVRVGVMGLPEPGLMPGITHVLSDETLAPADRKMLIDGQELIVVNGTLFAREPYERRAEMLRLPALETGIISIGAMARLPNLSPECAQVIGTILRRLPRSRLVLYGGDKVSDATRLTIREYFLNAGVAERVMFADPDEDEEAPTGQDVGRLTVSPKYWDAIDILIDTFPITGEAELCEALWNGVPTVTVRGPRRISCRGASIVAAANRPNWIVDDGAALVERVCEMAGDIKSLDEERSALLDTIGNAPLFDSARTARNVRAALVEAAKRARARA